MSKCTNVISGSERIFPFYLNFSYTCIHLHVLMFTFSLSLIYQSLKNSVSNALQCPRKECQKMLISEVNFVNFHIFIAIDIKTLDLTI